MAGEFYQMNVTSSQNPSKKHRIDNLTLHLKQLYKEEHTHTQNKISKRQEIINIRTELSEKEMKEAISSGQSLSRVQLFATPWIAACQASLSITNSRSSLRLTSIESVMPSGHLILCRSLLLLPNNPSQHQSLFQWVNSSHEVAKVLELQLQHHCLQRTPRVDLLQNGLVGSPCCPRDS